MEKMKNLTRDQVATWMTQRASSIWSNMMTNNLWQRMLKNTLATTITVIIAMNEDVVRVYGKAAYLAPITTVFGHPGRRFGMMAEALALAVSGTLLGLGWSVLGLYLSSLVYHSNSPAAYTIRGIFLAAALIFHGFLRSSTPRLFIMVLLLVIVSVVSLTSTAVSVSKLLATQILYPILTAVAVLLLVNTCVFPEFSSTFLGNTTTETLDLTVDTLRDAGRYFIQSIEPRKEPNPIETKSEEEKEPPAEVGSKNSKKSTSFSRILHFSQWHRRDNTKNENPNDPQFPTTVNVVKLKSLTDAKSKLRSKLESCKAAQQECNFELAFAVLPPKDLKSISVTEMQKLVASTIALIGACESKYALMGDQNPGATNPEPVDAVEDEKEATSGDESDSSQRGVTSAEVTSAEEISDYESDGRAEKKRKRRRRRRRRKPLERERENLELVKPIKEIESGDVELLDYLLKRIAQPLRDLQEKIDKSTDVINSCLAYTYDVPKLPSGLKAPTGIRIEELDIRVDIMREGLADFDRSAASALSEAVVLRDLHGLSVDLMPRMETFLISSFLLNYRQAAAHSLEMLKHARRLVEKRQDRHGHRRLYFPNINWRKWLTSGGEEDDLALPSKARKEVRTARQNSKENDGDDDDVPSVASSRHSLQRKQDEEVGGRDQPELGVPQRAVFNASNDGPAESLSSTGNSTKKAGKRVSRTSSFRNTLADIIEYISGSEDISYAVKLTVAVFLVVWPAFIGRWNSWYSLNRGLWAALQLVLITEVAIGTSVMTFSLRAVGTTIGCMWGWAAFEASKGNRPICIVMLVIGIIPSTYIQLGSKYIKAGMVSIISMCIVALATIDHTVPGSGTENFLKRLLAFLIGGAVALIVEMVLFPVKARTRLVDALAASILQIEEMEACLAYGVETEMAEKFGPSSPAVLQRFGVARSKAGGSLAAAEAFLPFCANEPRLKGSFSGLALIYGEIVYVLHQIVEKMDNMLQLRGEYGSSALEELHSEVYPYRRNVAGSITLILFAVHEALTTKLPLPQFMPSARVAHLRLVNKVRSILVDQQQETAIDTDKVLAKRLVRQKFLAFQAASAGQIEVIEYLEELQDLTKLLVGANEFRSGLLTRPTYREYLERISRVQTPQSPEIAAKMEAKVKDGEGVEQPEQEDGDEIRDVFPEVAPIPGGARKRSTFKRDGLEKVKTREREAEEKMKEAEEDELPRSLQRVRSRRVEERNAELTRISSRREEEKAWVAGREGLEGRK